MKYYVDSCIWINLFKKEENQKQNLWKIAEDFIKNNFETIVYSGIVLRELQIKLPKILFEKVRPYFDNFEKTNIDVEIRNEARRIESQFNFELSFYDCVNIVLAKKHNFILVTRDFEQIEKARELGVRADFPEKL